MNIIVYHKSGCPWAAAVMGFLKELKIPFEPRNVTINEEFARECETKSGKLKSPTVDFGSEILVDASVEDVAEHLEKRGVEI